MPEKKAKKGKEQVKGIAAKRKKEGKVKQEKKAELPKEKPREKAAAAAKPAEKEKRAELPKETPKEKAAAKEREKRAEKVEKAEKAKKAKPAEIKKIAEKLKKKLRIKFRGRFGNRGVRKNSIKKWQRWRKPRGIDIYREKEDGAYPKTGYRVPKAIRGRHPSGYIELLVRNEAELEKAVKERHAAIKLAAALGKRKRKLLIEKADKLGLIVLNG